MTKIHKRHLIDEENNNKILKTSLSAISRSFDSHSPKQRALPKIYPSHVKKDKDIKGVGPGK